MPSLKITNTYSLHYQLIQGSRAKPCLVFLHEGLGCTAMWKSFPQQLCTATGCPGLIYDRLGYGRSSPLTHTRTIQYIHDYAQKELPVLLEKVIPATPFILVGHSDGGSISLIYGAEQPPYLQAIITEAAHVFVDNETIAGIRDAKEAWEKGKLRSLLKYHGDKTETIFKAWSETWLSSWFKSWNIEYLLPKIKVPLLVIQGSDDHYGTEEQVNSIVTKSSGYAQAEILANCGHTPHLETQNVVLALMSDFIKRRQHHRFR